MAVSYYLDPSKADKAGDCPIRLRVSIMGKTMMTSTGLKTSPAKWDAVKQQMRKGTSNAAGMPWNIINGDLNGITDWFSRYESDCIAGRKAADSKAMKEQFKKQPWKKNPRERKPRKPREPKAEKNVLQMMVQFVSEEGGNKWTDATRWKFRTLRNHIEEYSPGISVDKMDDKFLEGFVSFLRNKKGQRNSTLQKNIALLRWFVHWTVKKGLSDNRIAENFKPRLRTSQKKVIFLEWPELMKVYGHRIPEEGTTVTLEDSFGKAYEKKVTCTESMTKARDIFCLCCFTSLRFSDAMNLKWSDVDKDHIKITTVKTADSISIDLNKYAREILSRYWDKRESIYVLPRLTNQKVNEALKDLCELCGINQPVTTTYYKGSERIDETQPKYSLISTHVGRRTFICNALMLGISPQVVMKWTGHSDYKAMKPYIDITSEAKAKAMALFDEK